MSVINEIINTYALFFDLDMWFKVLSDPVSWGLIFSLVVLEGLLSADNALVLAVMVKHLPSKQRKKALTYGLLGAYLFRFVFIGLGVYLVKFWLIKILGASYLAWMSINYFWNKGNEKDNDKEDEPRTIKSDSWLVRTFGVFWATVISVELMDIAFSVDSILAAFAVSDQVWVLLVGGMLGILMMRTVARFFLFLIDKVPELENTAFILIGIISLKMFANVFGYELPHTLFFIILVATFLATFVIHHVKEVKVSKQEIAATKEK